MQAMTLISLALVPFVGPMIEFGVYLPARFVAVAVHRWLPDGRAKRLLLAPL